LKFYLRFIVVGLAALSVGSALGTMPAQAKHKAATKISWHSEWWKEEYVVTKGPIYKNYRLTKKSKTKQRTFWSNSEFTIKKANGKRVTYRELQKNGHYVGYAAAKNVEKIKASDPRSEETKKKLAKQKKVEAKAFTKAERTQIATYRKQYKQIANTTKGMYSRKPSVKHSFNPGELSDKYINATVDSINFFRKMYGLNLAHADKTWNEDAQYGAAALNAAGKGLSHGLTGLGKPSFVSTSDWQRAAEATNSSNLGEGLTKPYNNILSYVNDGDNSGSVEPGHREWVLGALSKVGVGQSGKYNDLKVFGKDSGSSYHPETVAYPKAGVFPMSAIKFGLWSISYADRCDKDARKPVVKVYDNTTKKSVSVSTVGISNATYGDFGTTVYFLPDEAKTKVNHSYTVKVSHIENQSDVKYTTKLFDLND